MPNKLSSLLALIRFYNPTGTFLLFFPCAFGILLGASSKNDLAYLLMFFVGSFIMRSAGCIINDIWDIDIDKKVKRTKDRPLASGKVTIKESIILLGVLLFSGLIILLSLSVQAIFIGLFACVLVLIYPLMKRITFFPQVFLGVTYNIGLLMAYSTVYGSISFGALIAYAGTICWTISYDTIYAFMDIKDDPNAGVKSLALFIKDKDYKKWLFGLYGIFVKCFVIGILLEVNYNLLNLIISTISVVSIFSWQIKTLDINSKNNCLIRFKSNILVGLIWMITLV